MENLKRFFLSYYLGMCSLDEVITNIDSRNITTFIDWSIRNKVLSVSFPIVEDKMKSLPQNKEIETSYLNAKKIYMNYKKRRNLINESLKELSTLLNEKVKRYAYVKGLALEKYYPRGLQRFTNDIDIILEDENDLWDMLKVGISKGYEHTVIPTMRKNVHSNQPDEFVGLFKLQKETLDDEDYCWEFDLGGFTITDITHLPSSLIMEQTDNISKNQYNVRIPSVENHLLILIGEFVTRPYIYDRDVIDFLLLLKELSVNEIQSLETKVNKYKLQEELYRIANKVCELEINLTPLIDETVLEYFKKLSGRLKETDEKGRILEGHVYPYLSNFRNEHHVHRDFDYFKQRDYLNEMVDVENDDCPYIAELSKLNKNFKNPLEQLNSGHHTFLIHVNDKNYEKRGFKHHNGFYFLQTPSGLYWLSNEGVETEENYIQIEQLVGEGILNG